MLITCLERNLCEMRLSSVDSLVNGEDFLFDTYLAYIAFSGTNLGFSEGSRPDFRLCFNGLAPISPNSPKICLRQ